MPLLFKGLQRGCNVEKIFSGVRFAKIQRTQQWYEWRSREVPISYLSGRKLCIHLDFSDDELNEYQTDVAAALESTLQLGATARERTKKHLFAYYKDVEIAVGEECLFEDGMPALQTEETIFDYVNLNRLVLSQGHVMKKIYALFSGNCTWEPEHGVSVAFESGLRLAMVSGCSGHVCNSDAYSDLTLDRYIYFGSDIQTEKYPS